MGTTVLIGMFCVVLGLFLYVRSRRLFKAGKR